MAISPIKRAKSFFANIPDKKKDRIKKIAIEVLKVLGITLLGGLMGGLTLASSGTVWLIAGVALGVGTALGSYGGGKAFIQIQKKRVFPANPFRKAEPIDASKYFTEKKEKKFDKVMEKTIQPSPEYAEWKKQKGNISDRKAKRIFRKAIRGSCSLGQAHGLAATITKPNNGKVDASHLFTKKILQVMSADLGAKGQGLSDKILKIPGFDHHAHELLDPKNYFTHKKNRKLDKVMKETLKPLPEYAAWKKQKGNISDRKARGIFKKAILAQCALGQAYALKPEGTKKNQPSKEFPLGKFNDEVLILKEIQQVMAKDLGDKGKALQDKVRQINGNAPQKTVQFNKQNFPNQTDFIKDLKKPLMGTATFQRKDERHTIFFQVTDKGGKFYDGGHRLAGFHDEFGSREEFLKKFHGHIRAGMLGRKMLRKQYDSVEMDLFQIR